MAAMRQGMCQGSAGSGMLSGIRAPGSSHRPKREQGPDLAASLLRTIEADIIPRLLLAHRPPQRSPRFSAPSRSEVEEFTRLVLTRDLSIAAAFVAEMRARGAGLETLFLELLAPSARHLGDMWKADVYDFTDVTIGLVRLQRIMRELSFDPDGTVGAPGARVLLVPAPDEQHTFGLSMVQELFRRAGFEVWEAHLESSAALVELVSRERFEIVGFSASCEVWLERLSDVVAAVRHASLNPSVVIMVGGFVFNQRPELVPQVGADATAEDARQAVLSAPSILGIPAQEVSRK